MAPLQKSRKKKLVVKEQPTMASVFVYGTLKRGGVLHHHMKGGRFLGNDVVENCTLYMLEWYPAVVHGTSQVHGEVYEVDDLLLSLLDEVEGEGSLYKRKIVTTRNNRDVWLYFYLGSVDGAERIESGKFDVSNSNRDLFE